MRLSSIGAGLAAALVSGASASAEPIEWRVLDRYRLFDEADQSRERVGGLLDQLADQRVRGRPLSESYPALLRTLSGPAAADLRASNWSSERREYDGDYLYPTHYTVRARLADERSGTCLWLVDDVEAARADCSSDVDIHLKAGPLGDGWGGRANVEVRQDAAEPVRQTIEMRDVLVVAMGDSFISGEGNPDVPADLSRLTPSRTRRLVSWPETLDPATDDLKVAEWWDEPCHRSLLSWPVSTTLAWAAENPHRAVTLVHTGCSGSEIQDGVLGGQSGLPGCPDNPRPRRTCPTTGAEGRPQISQVRRLLGEGGRPIDRVLLSIGGNDIGFVGVIAFGILPPNGYRLPDGVVRPLGAEAGVVCPDEHVNALFADLCGDRPRAAERLETTLRPDYGHLRTALHGLGVAPEKVVQTQYPDILHASADGEFCQHAWRHADIESRNDRDLARLQGRYSETHLAQVVPAGFEVTQTMIPALFRGGRRWSWQFDLEPGFRCADENPPDSDLHRNGSDVCGAHRTWIGLNKMVAANGRGPGAWTIVSGHVQESRGHGWCRSDARYPLDMPVASRGPWTWRVWDRPYDRWIFDRDPRDLQGEAGQALRAAALAGPGSYEPYDFDQPRWFRTSVDSFRTQYGGPDRIIQGTVHPTFRTHIAYSDAVLRQSPPLPR
jgi:hypothetical protein